MGVFIGQVPTFEYVSVDKQQAIKILEEASEVVDAFKAYYKTRQTDWTEPDNVTDYQMALQHLLDECADVFQATCNLLSAVGVVDMTETIARCKAKNERRGYEYECDLEPSVQKCSDDTQSFTEVGKTSSSSCKSDGTDSREQLEADVRKVLQSAYMYAWMHGYENRRGCSFEKLHSEFYSLLDRQAAITRAECDKPNWGYCETCEADRQIEDMRKNRDELQSSLDSAKRAIAKAGGTWTEDDDGAVAVVFAPDVDKLLADLEAARAKNRALKAHISKMQDGRHGWHVKAKELQERNDVQYVTIERLLKRNSELQEEVDSLADERDTWRDKFGKALDLAHEIARLQE